MCVAIELARTAFPGEVVRLELEFANYLTSLRQHDAAILHFIEAGYGSLSRSLLASSVLTNDRF